jgi:hypothetical protein
MKPYDNIENLILTNLERLNEEEPPSGHSERFEARLRDEGKIRNFQWNRVWKVAAAVVFVLLVFNQMRMWISSEPENSFSLADVSPEYAEVEYYYTAAIQNGIETLNGYAASGLLPDDEHALMQQEFREFERRYEELQIEFEANPYDERVINAMMDYYQAKLDVLTLIINKLHEVKQQKIMSHEREV